MFHYLLALFCGFLGGILAWIVYAIWTYFKSLEDIYDSTPPRKEEPKNVP